MANPDQKQVPGVYRQRIGDAMVTVINDGYLDMPFELLRGVSLDEMRALMCEVFHDGPPRITVNAYVVQTGGRTILVDAGGGSTTVFSMGLLPENLRAAGFSPADFDMVVLTHIHPDHSSGLLGTSGEPMFSRAEISYTRTTLHSGPIRDCVTGIFRQQRRISIQPPPCLAHIAISFAQAGRVPLHRV